MFLTRDECAQLVRMGPSAWHVDEQSVDERLGALPEPLTVTASMTLSVSPARGYRLQGVVAQPAPRIRRSNRVAATRATR